MGRARTLLLGWGNPGRKDDGLGPELARLVDELALPGLTVESDYQLAVEDAAEVAAHDRVLFVDADRSGPEPFSCRPLEPAAPALGFSSHSVSPAGLLALASGLFRSRPEAWLLGIRGYEFDDFAEGLSAGARSNLEAAVDYVATALRRGRFDAVPAAGGPSGTAPADDETN